MTVWDDDADAGSLRVLVAEDDVLLREGIARLLTDGGFEVVAQAADAEDLLRKGLAHRPDVVVADVRMPPRHEDDGLTAAIELRRRLPEVGVLVLSQFYEEKTVAGALRAAVALRPDVALVDIGLPDGDGFEVAGEIAQLAGAPRVVLISADADAADDAAARRVGAIGFVAKEELEGARLRRLLDG